MVQYRLIVRQVKTLQITRLYTCLDAIQHVEVTASVHATVIMYVLYSNAQFFSFCCLCL